MDMRNLEEQQEAEQARREQEVTRENILRRICLPEALERCTFLSLWLLLHITELML
jgi:DNA-binding TFAR19-related protein (PDSD5 family)